MQMDQASQARLKKLSQAAQAVIYDEQRGQEFVELMQQGLEGQLQAVMSILSIIEQKSQIERPLLIPLAMTVLALLVDFTGKALGKKPDMGAMGEVQKALIDRVVETYSGQPGGGQPQQPAQMEPQEVPPTQEVL